MIYARSGAYLERVGSVFREVGKSIHRTQICMPLKPVFSRHKRDGVQITDVNWTMVRLVYSVEKDGNIGT